MAMDRISRYAEIERLLIWRGRISPHDVALVTGVSSGTTAADLKRYAKAHPRNIRRIAISCHNNRVAHRYEPRPAFRAVYFQVLSVEQFADLATEEMPVVREYDRLLAGVFPALAAALRTKAVVRLMTAQGERIGIPVGFRRVSGVWHLDLFVGSGEPMRIPLATVTQVSPSGEVAARSIRDAYVVLRERERLAQVAAAEKEAARKKLEAQDKAAEARAMTVLKCKSEEWIRRGFLRQTENQKESTNANA